MNQPFNHILTLLFRHRYFSDNQCKPIHISYPKETLRLMMNLGIVIKFFPGGAHLLASDPELLKATDDSDPLRLILNSKDDRFINYTELPPYQINSNILYFNNRKINPESGGNSFPLHNGKFVAQNDVVPVSDRKITIPRFDTEKTYHFTDASGNEIASRQISQIKPNSGDFYISNLPEGLIYVKEGKQDVNKIYTYTNTIWKKPLGILEIFTDKLWEHYKEYGKSEYIIHFNHRQTIWKYFFVTPVYHKFNNLTIINKSKEQVFKTPVKKQFHEQKEALVFESKNRIPISEFSNNTFQLVDGYDPERKIPGKVIIRKLANASPDLLYRDETNSSETIYSHIFI